jgi:hypothetical protein
MMQKIDLNDLPQWSSWPKRLLFPELWKVPTRTIDKVEQEYNQDEYARCLAYYQNAGDGVTPEEIKRFQSERKADDPVCVAFGNELYQVTFSQSRAEYLSLLVNSIRPLLDSVRTIVELGSGYGFNLWVLKKQLDLSHFLVGGEYSENAVRLAELLCRETPQLKVHSFNFYEPESYKMLAACEPPVLVFTAHAIEQLPSCAAVIDNLLLYRELIHTVVHFEPAYDLHDASLLGLMRRRYAEVNDYNRDLLVVLQARSFVDLVETQADVYGINPLNPASIVQWRFR